MGFKRSISQLGMSIRKLFISIVRREWRKAKVGGRVQPLKKLFHTADKRLTAVKMKRNDRLTELKEVEL